ncbi:hypothetical protein DPEC_G00316910 [Dallia pectoralis]|uniref:Uncharacterized protein n=1 Tax=Dallia pectoralis TaxID=75939 RepID=A0ACC2FCY8_DALPE|nr:hypothetical protein DPEC_G00316910 [Dallia pectoralis]
MCDQGTPTSQPDGNHKVRELSQMCRAAAGDSRDTIRARRITAGLFEVSLWFRERRVEMCCAGNGRTRNLHCYALMNVPLRNLGIRDLIPGGFEGDAASTSVSWSTGT